jgi:signal transduction histidine kinase
MQSRRARNLETEFHYGDGESAWFQLSVQPVPEGLFILSLDITKRKEAERFQQLQYDVALILSENNSLTDAVRGVLEQICRTFGWRAGEFWAVERDSNRLRLLSHWASEEVSYLWEDFAQNMEMESGTGIPGHVWHSRSPLFVANVSTDENFLRREMAEELGMQSAFAFPITARDEVLGVTVFFGGVSRPPNEDLMTCFAAIGSGLSQFLERKKLEREVLEISHKEQNRLGRDLHDGLGQQLTALELFSVSLAQEADSKSRALGKKVRKLGEHLRDAIKQTRAMANGLCPVSLNEGGLVTALSKLADSTSTMASVECEFLCPSPVEVGLDASIHLYRIAQETTNNALKHGGAKRIQISLAKREDGQLQLSIEDNGRGFSNSVEQSGGMGLRVMRYRAGLIGGKIDIESTPGKGTRVTCILRKFA